MFEETKTEEKISLLIRLLIHLKILKIQIHIKVRTNELVGMNMQRKKFRAKRKRCSLLQKHLYGGKTILVQKGGMMQKTKSLIQAITKAAIAKARTKNSFDDSSIQNTVEEVGVKFINDLNESESKLIGKIGEVMDLSISSSEIDLISKASDLEHEMNQISEELGRFSIDIRRLYATTIDQGESIKNHERKCKRNELESRNNREKLKGMEIDYLLTKDTISNFARILRQHNESSGENFKAVDEKLNRMSTIEKHFKEQHEKSLEQFHQTKKDVVEMKFWLEKQVKYFQDNIDQRIIPLINTIGAKYDSIEDRINRDFGVIDLKYYHLESLIEDMIERLQRVQGDAGETKINLEAKDENLISNLGQLSAQLNDMRYMLDTANEILHDQPHRLKELEDRMKNADMDVMKKTEILLKNLKEKL
ncbi:hypothetical protein QAD02_002706 [Eretmocerus hayati]|uniref:Uncharacterized protein n=1 Tax=Eretmocerus hayati TaxID=131215 RepID=A0ACC2NK29_9HYME|nr:hypothetical protein QAD02_002706 [Eretmocerus hayati]